MAHLSGCDKFLPRCRLHWLHNLHMNHRIRHHHRLSMHMSRHSQVQGHMTPSCRSGARDTFRSCLDIQATYHKLCPNTCPYTPEQAPRVLQCRRQRLLPKHKLSTSGQSAALPHTSCGARRPQHKHRSECSPWCRPTKFHRVRLRKWRKRFRQEELPATDSTSLTAPKNIERALS